MAANVGAAESSLTPFTVELTIAWANPLDIEPRIDDDLFARHEAMVGDAGRSASLAVSEPVARTSMRSIAAS